MRGKQKSKTNKECFFTDSYTKSIVSGVNFMMTSPQVQTESWRIMLGDV